MLHNAPWTDLPVAASIARLKPTDCVMDEDDYPWKDGDSRACPVRAVGLRSFGASAGQGDRDYQKKQCLPHLPSLPKVTFDFGV